MRVSRKAFCAALLGATAIPAGMAILPASAQEASIAFELAQQDLGATLRALARQGGREILFADADIRGRQAPAIRGRFTIEEAVRRAIAGTDLVVEQQAGALVVRVRARAAAEDGTDPAIMVTGTRIRGATGPSPVIVMTRRGLEEQGLPDMASISRIIPQNFTGGQNPGVAGGGDQGGYNNLNNATTLNLRGLGSDATLTLINGHRLPYDAVNQGVDISIIPLAALERIEVITDGASALYGSDAVGGVANLILRRDYDGIQASARIGGSADGGNVQQQYSGVGGARWTGGGFMAAIDYSKATPIYADQRDYTRGLAPSQMLGSGYRQVSGVLTGHQDLASWVSFELDAELADRRSRKGVAYSVTAPVTTYGQLSLPIVRSYSVTPSLHFKPGGGWEATLAMTDGESATVSNAKRYINGLTLGRSAYDNHLTNFEASAEGPLARLPGGEARLALGGGYRRFRLDFDVRSTSGGVTTIARDASERRESLFGYGELSLPLVGAANRMPWLDALRLSAAVRYERYAGIDEVATPKLGLIYAPHPGITLKYSWGKSFKIPTLNQVNQARQAILLRANQFSTQPTPPLPAGSTVLLVAGGNADLRAERATSSTLSIEFKPLDGLRIEASGFDIDYRGRIANAVSDYTTAFTNPAAANFVSFAPSASQLHGLIAEAPLGLENQSGQAYDPARVAAVVDASLRNTAREHARGVDVAIDYSAALRGGGQLQLAASASYLDDKRQPVANQPYEERAGLIFTPPHWRARASASWQSRTLQFAAALNYAGSTLDRRRPPQSTVGAFTTLDLSGSFRPAIEHGPLAKLELRLTVQNLLNEAPDPISNPSAASIPFDSTNQSPIGRFVALSVTKQW
ncbi:TonB-dependent receptor [Sphingomonas sp. NIBR02145]|uniref:TonB-dependent receptor n=1 Tax=Sphingomonas sp. NIBR02145 TaxID=3014784 RepID=UPI0022B55578|nr:TonB-dependent receptor [Sphingomonas sp. NIBR02145]WHU02425.1 TonB-dependent receptor [Sphingomonas sp. NIBR02145]